jgi:hypothetical protein
VKSSSSGFALLAARDWRSSATIIRRGLQAESALEQGVRIDVDDDGDLLGKGHAVEDCAQVLDSAAGGVCPDHQLKSVEGRGLFDRRRERLPERDPPGESVAEADGQVLRSKLREPLVRRADVKKNGVEVGREIELLSELEFLSRESIVIVVPGELDGGTVRSVGLNQHFTDAFPASGTPGYLSEKLEGAFRGAKIRYVQTEIGVEDSDERDVRKIQTFGDHLRADEDIETAGPERIEGIAQCVLAAHGVGVHAGDPGIGEK